jgi:hypothetical protein
MGDPGQLTGGRPMERGTFTAAGSSMPGPLARTEMTQDQQDKQCRRIWDKAARQTSTLAIPQLTALTRSRTAVDRLFALMVMRRQMETRGPVRGYFPLAKRLIRDANNNCRWQALIVVGEFIKEMPEVVWPIVLRFGSCDDEDMRAGVATVLLEHLLEYHRRVYEPLLNKHIQNGNASLAATLSMCWDLGPGARRQSG